MLAILTKLSPIFLIFILGVLLRKLKFADIVHGEFLLKFIFFIALPSLILIKVSNATITPDKYALPLISILINLSCLSLMFLFSRFIVTDRQTLGSMFVCVSVMNNMILYPFILYGMGDSAFSDLVLLDLGNAITTATVSYGIALRYGQGKSSYSDVVLRLVSSPIIWALIIALILSTYAIPLPLIAQEFFTPLGAMASPLILLSLGIFFSPKLDQIKLFSITLMTRSVFGLLVGMVLAKLFGFSGETFAVISISAAAPIGFTALAFSSIGRLNVAFTSSVVSLSIMLGMFYIPLMLFLFTVQ